MTVMINPDKLLPGDLLFFMDSSRIPIHVGIYSGEKSGVHFVTHAVTEPHNAVMTTRLKPEDVAPYQVFRCKNFSLASQAALRLRCWSKNNIPFSHEKHAEIYENIEDDPKMCHPKKGGAYQMEYAQKYFAPNIYRYISIASHPEWPSLPNPNEMEGFYCSEAIACAFTVQELIHYNAVVPMKQLNVAWVSNKTELSLSFMKKHYEITAEFEQFLSTATSQNEYSIGHLKMNEKLDGAYPPSIVAWNYNLYPNIEDFASQHEFVLPLDSKLATPRALYEYCKSSEKQWDDLGPLTVKANDYRLADLENKKKEWKTYVEHLFHQAKRRKSLENLHIADKNEKHTFPCLLEKYSKYRPRRHSVDGSMTLHATNANPETVPYLRALKFTSPAKPVPKNISTDSDVWRKKSASVIRKLNFG